MKVDISEIGGAYQVFVAEDNSSVYVRLLPNDAVGTDGCRARAYSPDLGRFLQQDPAGMVDGPNLYAYCGNEPVGRRDPGGMFSIKINRDKYDRCIARNTADLTLAMIGCIVSITSAPFIYAIAVGIPLGTAAAAPTGGISAAIPASMVVTWYGMLALCIAGGLIARYAGPILACAIQSLYYDNPQHESTVHTIITTVPTAQGAGFVPYSYPTPITTQSYYGSYFNPTEKWWHR